MKRYYLGLDQGTTGTTALLFDENFNQVAKGYKAITQHYPQSGWVEHDGEELYLSLLEATQIALNEIGATAADIKCIGIDNQGETVILWDKQTGKPIYRAIVWQDRRTAETVDAINAENGQLFYDKTALKLDAYFGATKIKWVLENVADARSLLAQGRLAAGSLDSWFIWKLTGGKVFATDCVTASRTCLMNLRGLCWDQDILDYLEIPVEILPEIRENATLFGKTCPDCFLGAEVPITCSIVDQQAALFGQACCSAGDIKTTYGTGCFMLTNTGNDLIINDKGLISTLAIVHNGKASYALDGGIYISGAATKWLRDGLKIIDNYNQMDELAFSLQDNGDVYFVPAFTGLAAPYWDSYARGAIVGLTGGCTNAHIARATLEATAYQVKDIFDLFNQYTNSKISVMRADGGSTASQFLMQFQADILGVSVEIPKISESTGLGAAFIAALGAGDVSSLDEIKSLWQYQKVYEPKMSEDQRQYLLARWHKAVQRSMAWSK